MRIGRRSYLVTAGLVAAAAVPFLTGASAATQHTSTAACGATITASVTLTADLACAGSNGLVIGANNVVVNLGGHTLSGNGTNYGIDDVGGFTGLTVENGVIDDFNNGILVFGGANNAKFMGLRVQNQVNSGILVSAANGAKITGSYLVSNGDVGIGLTGTTGDSVSGSWIEGNSSYGIAVSNGLSLLITRNTVLDNTAGGIDIGGTSSGSVTGNIVNDNKASGISAGPAFTGVKSPLTVGKNRASFNTNYGILAPGAVVNDGGGNTVQDNGSLGQCEGVVCVKVSG